MQSAEAPGVLVEPYIETVYPGEVCGTPRRFAPCHHLYPTGGLSRPRPTHFPPLTGASCWPLAETLRRLPKLLWKGSAARIGILYMLMSGAWVITSKMPKI